jgi:proteic killer suppression protein
LIVKIKHAGLRRFWETEQTKGLNPVWIEKFRRILFALDLAANPTDMDFPGFRLHALKRELAGFYAVDVSGNWRIIFRFEEGNTTDIDLIDYH